MSFISGYWNDQNTYIYMHGQVGHPVHKVPNASGKANWIKQTTTNKIDEWKTN